MNDVFVLLMVIMCVIFSLSWVFDCFLLLFLTKIKLFLANIRVCLEIIRHSVYYLSVRNISHDQNYPTTKIKIICQRLLTAGIGLNQV